MDWSNERYVRIFTRDTLTVRRWPWHVRALWWDFLRRVDRAGVVDLAGGDLSEAIELLCSVPPEVAAECSEAWSSSGCLVVGDGRATVPNFLEAQETPMSDAARARASRERRSSLSRMAPSVTERNAPVTNGDETVTPRHAQSRRVTPAFPSLPDPTLPDPSLPGEGECEGERRSDASRPQPAHDQVLERKIKTKKPKLVEAELPGGPTTREVDPPQQRARAKAQHELPEGWTPPPELYPWARSTHAVRLDKRRVEEQLERFRDHALSSGRRCRDWTAAFRSWLRKAREFAPDLPEPGPDRGGPQPPPRPPDALELRMKADIARMKADLAAGKALPPLSEALAAVGSAGGIREAVQAEFGGARDDR